MMRCQSWARIEPKAIGRCRAAARLTGLTSVVVRQAAQTWWACMETRIPSGQIEFNAPAGGNKAFAVSTSTAINLTCGGTFITYDGHLNCILSLPMN